MEKIANIFKLKKKWEENLTEVINFWAKNSIDTGIKVVTFSNLVLTIYLFSLEIYFDEKVSI